MKRIAKWLNEHHFPVFGNGGRETVCYLWCIVISFSLMTLFGAIGWKGKEFEILCAALYLGASVVPPVLAGIVALIKHEKWNPWHWFPTLIGFVVGGFIAIAAGLVFGWCTLF